MENKSKTFVREFTLVLTTIALFSAFLIVVDHFYLEPKTKAQDVRFAQWDIMHESNQRSRLMVSGDILRSHGIPVDENSLQSAYSKFEDEHIYLFAIWNSVPSLYKVIVAYSQEKGIPLTVSNIDEAVNGGLLWERLRVATERDDRDGGHVQ